MTKWIASVGTVMAMGAVVGCESSGLSYREQPGRDHGTYVRALYDLPYDTEGKVESKPLSGPAKVAVVQVGEVSPQNELLQRLRKEPEIFSRVESISDSGGNSSAPTRDQYNRDVSMEVAKQRLTTLTNVARDMGMDYVLLIGGTIDSTQNATPLSILNVTIVGAFVIPSDQTRAEVKASGAMVDVRTGRVALISSAQVQGGHLTPAISTEGEKVALFRKLRDEVTKKLANQVIEDCKGAKTETARME